MTDVARDAGAAPEPTRASANGSTHQDGGAAGGGGGGLDGGAGPAGLGNGFALPSGVRSRVAPAVGGDLADVRLHTDPAAGRLARAAGAIAVTEGRHVAFAPGWYRPGTLPGDVVLAHELAHTRQQRGSPVGAGPLVSGPGGGALEAEADRAAFLSALRLLDPDRAARLGPAPLSAGQPLQLQRCSAPVSDIDALPTREDYERAGELLPRALENLQLDGPEVELGQAAGQVLVLSGPMAGAEPPAWGGTGVAPLAADLGAASPTLAPEQLSTRLAAMELVQRRIQAEVEDLGPEPTSGLLLSLGGAALWTAQGRARGGPGFVLVLPGALPGDLVPEGVPELSREVARSEVVQARCLDALSSLRDGRAQQVATGQKLPGYDVEGALSEIDNVRRDYRDAADAILTPRAVDRLTEAETQHAKLHRTLLRHELTYFEDRTSKYREIQSSITAIRDWSWMLQERLAALEAAIPALLQEREAQGPGLAALEHRLTRQAQLIAVSIEALGEWDMAVQAFEFLRGNTALWGFEGVDAIAWRLGQMKSAAYDDDLPYLELLLREHQRDPKVRDYYQSLPEVVAQSHFILTLAITLIALLAAAGIGAAFFAASPLLLKAGAEALVFTVVSRSLSSLVPGMEPKTAFWMDLLWNFGLFATMTWATKGVQAALAAAGAARLVQGAAVAGTAYVILQGYGLLRFFVETGRGMTAAEFGRMSVENLIMLAALSVATVPFRPVLGRLEHLSALRSFRSTYGERFAELDVQRTELERDTQQRMKDQPDATLEDLADLRGRAEDLDSGLRSLVEEVVLDPNVRPDVLRQETAELFQEIGSTALPDLFADLGIDPSIQLRPSGEEGAWSHAPGSTDALVSFLEANGYSVGPESTVGSGQRAVEAAIEGKGRVTFVERPTGIEGAPEPSAPAPEAAPRARRPTAEPSARQTRQLEEVRNLRQRVYRMRRDGRVGDAVAKVFLEQLTNIAKRVRMGDPAMFAEIDAMREALTVHRRALRPTRPELVERLEQRLRRQSERARDPDAKRRFGDLADQAARVRHRMRTEPSYDPRNSVDVIRRQERTAGAIHYDVYIQLDDPATFREVSEWLTNETKALLDYPGGEFLRNEMLDQLYGADEMVLQQSPRQAGLDVAKTREMRARVLEGIAEGRYPPEFVEAFEANVDAEGWPRTPDGRPWEIDHVYELWQGGADNLGNYLPVDPRLHRMKSNLLRRFRTDFRERYRAEDEQVEVTSEL